MLETDWPALFSLEYRRHARVVLPVLFEECIKIEAGTLARINDGGHRCRERECLKKFSERILNVMDRSTKTVDIENLKLLVQRIVKQALDLKNAHTDQDTAPVNYACIFSQTEREHRELCKAAEELGAVVRETPNGPLFRIAPLATVSGKLQLLKIRAPDQSRPERGDADFTVLDYPNFKKCHLAKPGFKLIIKEQFEMIELRDAAFDVRAYFSYPPLTTQLNIE